MAARFYHQDRRDEVLQVLQALEDVPDTQRQALCAQLLAQEPVASHAHLSWNTKAGSVPPGYAFQRLG